MKTIKLFIDNQWIDFPADKAEEIIKAEIARLGRCKKIEQHMQRRVAFNRRKRKLRKYKK